MGDMNPRFVTVQEQAPLARKVLSLSNFAASEREP
jgi:hypothetical protein